MIAGPTGPVHKNGRRTGGVKPASVRRSRPGHNVLPEVPAAAKPADSTVLECQDSHPMFPRQPIFTGIEGKTAGNRASVLHLHDSIAILMHVGVGGLCARVRNRGVRASRMVLVALGLHDACSVAKSRREDPHRG